MYCKSQVQSLFWYVSRWTSSGQPHPPSLSVLWTTFFHERPHEWTRVLDKKLSHGLWVQQCGPGLLFGTCFLSSFVNKRWSLYWWFSVGAYKEILIWFIIFQNVQQQKRYLFSDECHRLGKTSHFSVFWLWGVELSRAALGVSCWPKTGFENYICL